MYIYIAPSANFWYSEKYKFLKSMDWSLVTEFISLQNHVLQIFFLRVEIKVRIINRPSLSQIVICLPLWSCIWAFRGSYHYIRDTRKCSPKTLPLKSCSDLKKDRIFSLSKIKVTLFKDALVWLRANSADL